MSCSRRTYKEKTNKNHGSPIIRENTNKRVSSLNPNSPNNEKIINPKAPTVVAANNSPNIKCLLPILPLYKFII